MTSTPLIGATENTIVAVGQPTPMRGRSRWHLAIGYDKLILQEATKGNFQTPRADVSSSSTSGAHSRYPSVVVVSKKRAFSMPEAQLAAAHAGRKAARVRATRFWP